MYFYLSAQKSLYHFDWIFPQKFSLRLVLVGETSITTTKEEPTEKKKTTNNQLKNNNHKKPSKTKPIKSDQTTPERKEKNI